MGKIIIEAKNLSKSYSVKDKVAGLAGSLKSIFAPQIRNIEAVKNVTFQISEGEMVGFIGPNGAGKTTTLKMLSGILYPTGGTLTVLGSEPSKRQDNFLKQISLVMGQKNQLIWDLPAIDTFNLNAKTYDLDQKAYKHTLDELVELFDLSQILNQQVRRLSLGQRMKCELVASLLHRPKILFLDEPTIGLDIIIQKKLRQFIKDFNQKFGTTVILTSHYMDDVKEIANRIIIINMGSLVFDDSLNALTKKYANYKILSFVLNKKVDRLILAKLGEVIRYEYPTLELRCQPEDVAQVTSTALKLLDVDDIDISEVKLEDIVSQIFDHS